MKPVTSPFSQKGEGDVRVKICGLSRREDIRYANEAGPDYVGFVFARSRRQVSAQEAADSRRRLREDICPVGVFVNEKPEQIVRLLQRGVIDAAQLHGQETEAEIAFIRKESGKPVIKAIQITDGRELAEWKDSEADYLLFDGGSGEGKTFDWSLAGLARTVEKPFFLAGGLHACNVAEAVRLFAPFALDVSSGVEWEGKKDQGRITDFMKAVRICMNC